MKISIIIPYYNGTIFYERLINSISLAAKRIEPNQVIFEVITIIDSVNTDEDIINLQNRNSFTVNNNLKYRILKNKVNMGVAASRNFAMEASTGDFLHLIDQDDEVTESFYEQVIDKLAKYNFILTNGMVHYSDKIFNKHKLYYFSPQLSITGIIKDDFIRSPGQVLFSKALLGNAAGFPVPKKYKGTDDRFFWIRMFLDNKDIKPYYNKTPNYSAYIHDNNYSADLKNMKRSELENWHSFDISNIQSPLKRLIENDILRIRLTLGENLTSSEYLRAVMTKIIYFFKANKIIRFVIKRKKW